MASQLRLVVPAYPPIPLLGGHAIAGGCIALEPEIVHYRMARQRDHLGEHYRRPPDPVANATTGSPALSRDRLLYETYRHREYLAISAAVEVIEEALRRGEDLEVAAVLHERGSGEIERWSGAPIFERHFSWVECRDCERRYAPEECGETEWSQIADVRAGFGGKHLVCPAGHVVFAKQTWIS